MDPITALKIASTVGGLFYSNKLRQEAKGRNRELSRSIDKQVSNLEGTLPSIDEFTEGLIDLEMDESSVRSDRNFLDFLRQSEDLSSNLSETIKQSDLVFSGDLQNKFETDKSFLESNLRIREDAGSLNRERNLLNILTRKEDQKSSVANKIFSLKTQQMGLDV